jgi:hypothetical protein
MNRYWEVARTYLYRPGFWVFALIYLVVGSLLDRDSVVSRQSLSLLPLAAATCCFIAIHLRRQFGTAAARITPGFAAPHLAMGALASLLVCVIVPLGLAWKTEADPLGTIGRYSLAGVLLAIVVRRPMALVLLAAIPAIFVWFEVNAQDPNSFVVQFLFGDEPAPLIVMVVISLVSQTLAGIYLLRLGTLEITTSDDLLIGSRLDSADKGSLSGIQLRQQDALVERKLDHVGRWGWSVDRWRIPVAPALAQLALAVVATAAFVAVYAITMGNRGQALLPLMVSSSLFLAAPFSTWQSRRRAFGMELMRPVARDHFWREMILAMAWDVAIWTGAASLVAVVGSVVLMTDFVKADAVQEGVQFIVCYVAVLWSMAAFMLGVALLTMRFRYWLPLVLSAGLAWCFAGFFFMVLMLNHHGSSRGPTAMDLCVFPIITTGCGLFLTWCAYHRWREADIA